MKLENLKVATRLTVGFGLVCALLIANLALGVNRLGALGTGIGDIVNDKLPKVEFASDLLEQSDVIALAVRNMMLNPDAADRALQMEAIKQARAFAQHDMDGLNRIVASGQGKELLARVAERGAAYLEGQDALVATIQGGKDGPARDYLNSTLRPRLAAYRQALKDQIAHERERIDQTGVDGNRSYETGRRAMLAIGAAALVLAAAIGFLIQRSITRQLGGEPTDAAQAADRIAAGDLVTPVTLRPGDTTSLLHALHTMRESLQSIVGSVRSGTDAIAQASGEIAAGNQDLSQRTEEQASALEETAASMEQLTGTVKQNADNARQGHQLARTAADVAVRGGEVVGQVVETMTSIEQSSRHMADIISVIDGIAFQTNILALNAAVEAARAGEQGRGFAVVAAEVRNLAQRSSTAAKEIKDLIDDSVSKVDAGSQLVGRAGASMGEIVASIKHVSQIMTDIADASEEQTRGIEQVHQAITQMDQVTQQNAALVEQAAAAAQSMREQATGLVGAVSIFRLGAEREPTRIAARAPIATPRVDPQRLVPNAKAAFALPGVRARAALPAGPGEWAEF